MITDKKLAEINNYLSKWNGASYSFNSFNDSMTNRFTIALHLEGKQLALTLCTCQYIRGNFTQNNINLVCEKTIYQEAECFLLKDLNSDFLAIVGSGIFVGTEILFAVND